MTPHTPLPARLDAARVPGVYTWIAPVYDVLAVAVTRRARRVALERAGIRDGEAVLEVAVGTGLTFRRVLASNPHGRNEGVDLTPAMLRRAERRAARSGASGYRLRLGDARALDFADETFDVVLGGYLLDLLPASALVPVLREFGRVLRPGGRLVLLHMTTGRRPGHRLWERLYRLWPVLLGGSRGIRAAPSLQAAGFTGVRRAYVAECGFPSEVVSGVKAAG